MTSFQIDIDPRELAAGELIADVGQQLQQMLAARKAERGLTQRELAERIGIDRARVNKCFGGFANLTLKSLAELAWAMDAEIDIVVRSKSDPAIQIKS